jgi:osmotically-inducible protein OsmY
MPIEAESHRRKDAEIAKAVMNVLKWYLLIPSEVKVDVENGAVTLSGEVSWVFKRPSIEDAILYLSGVKSVVNNIDLLPLDQGIRSTNHCS